MRLIALKIGDEYGVLNKHLLCFDSEFIIKIDESDGKTNVVIDNHNHFIPNFFSERVSGITAIVGKNGVGKTTIIRYLRELFIKETSNLRYRNNDIIILEYNSKIVVYLNEERKHRIDVVNNTRYQSDILYYRGFPKLYDKVGNVTTCYYSNNLDLEQSGQESKNYFNISTSFLTENIGKLNLHLRNKKIRYQGGHSRFRFTEIKRQIDFINYLRNLDADLDIPFKSIDSLILNIREVLLADYFKFQQNIKRVLEIETSNVSDELIRFDNLFTEYIDKVKGLKNQSKSSKSFLWTLIIENAYFLLIQLLVNSKTIFPYWRRLKLKESPIEAVLKYLVNDGFVSTQSYKEVFEYSTRTLSKATANAKELQKDIRNPDDLMKLLDSIKNLNDLVDACNAILESGEVDRNTIMFDINNVGMIKFLDFYFENPLDLKFIEFTWSKLSAGEEALIAFYSRLKALSDEVKSENLIMLIDEGDLYFHPEWQRCYLYYLLQFLQSPLVSFSRIQIILTSHSPFIVSDLPSENIIFLDKNRDGQVRVINPKESDIETFGGNIHSLYTKAFFMRGSTMSEFALRKIREDIAEQLESRDGRANLESIGNLINKIGDPVLKSIFLDRLKEYDSNKER